MMNLALFVLLSCFAVKAKTESYCNFNVTIGQLPTFLAEEVFFALLGFIDSVPTDCSKDLLIPKDAVKFWLFDRTRSWVLVNSTNPVEVDASKSIKVLIHGWLCNVTDGGIPELTAAYLQRYDCTVIAVDWSALSVDYCSSGHCNAPYVGNQIGIFLCNLIETLYVSEDDIHVVGHSMGAHIAGFAGQAVKGLCTATIGRITALDAMGFVYHLMPELRRLHKTDGKLVDVIHTAMGTLGYLGDIGLVDFYPNCGYVQPGCLDVRPSSLTDILNYSVPIIFCSHFRSLYLMVESIISNDFVSYSYTQTYPDGCVPDLIYGSTTYMGENCPSNPLNTRYTLCTNSKPTYAMGANSSLITSQCIGSVPLTP